MRSTTRRRTRTVGRITVHVDSHGNPWKFTDPAGSEVECICQPGIRCEFHLREIKERATGAPKSVAERTAWTHPHPRRSPGEDSGLAPSPEGVRGAPSENPVENALAELLAAAQDLSGIPIILLVTRRQPGAGPGRGGGQHLIR